MDIIRSNTQSYLQTVPDLRPGLTVKVHQKIKDGNKTRSQIFEGIIIAHKHGGNINGTVTVRKISDGIGVERVFPIHLPTIEKFEVVKTSKVRRAKLYYLRGKSAKQTKRKMKSADVKLGSKAVRVSETSTAPEASEASAVNETSAE